MSVPRNDSMFADIPLDEALHDAFLIHLVDQVRRGVATVEDRTIPGLFGVCPSSGRPTFTPDPGQGSQGAPPPPSHAVELCYHHDGTPSWFDSSVVTTGIDGTWQLRRPSFVTAATRRLVPRLRCEAREGLRLQFEAIDPRGSIGSLQLQDISLDGLGLHFHPRQASIEKGQRLEGWLSMPGLHVLPVGLTVVAVPLAYPGSRTRRASARFMSMSLADRRILARNLAILTGQGLALDIAAAK
jgi:hypothetical protein